MDSIDNMLELCRLCLVKDNVNIPIFEEQCDIREIFLKISSCLPIKLKRDDQLPKKICDSCSSKLDMVYDFWNCTANAEKQLLTWLGEAGMNTELSESTMSAVAQHIKPVETLVKQEDIDPSDEGIAKEENEDPSYIQQKFDDSAAGPSKITPFEEEEEEDEEPPPPKRARRKAAEKAAIVMEADSEEDDEDSGDISNRLKSEDESSEGEEREPAFVDVPSTSADDQSGPSGVGKEEGEAPPTTNIITFLPPKLALACEISTYEDDSFNEEDDGVKIRITKSIKRPKSKTKKRHLRDMVCQAIAGSNSLGNTDDKTFACGYCVKRFAVERKLFAHMRFHHAGEKPFSCMICGKGFTQRALMMSHQRIHTGEKPFSCETCSKSFRRKIQLKTHQRIHTGEKPHVCEFCGKLFSHSNSLKSHQRLHTGEKPYSCKFCNLVFAQRPHMMSHQRTHTGEKPHRCSLCGKCFGRKTHLKNHERTHTGEKPYPCELCEKTFGRPDSLKDHQRVHTGEQPYSCNVCGQGFAQRNHMTTHQRIHTGEKPYHCEFCNKSFSLKMHLKTHQRIHTGEKPYACGVCNKRFGDRTNFKKHQRIHVVVSPMPIVPVFPGKVEQQHLNEESE